MKNLENFLKISIVTLPVSEKFSNHIDSALESVKSAKDKKWLEVPWNKLLLSSEVSWKFCSEFKK